MNYKSEKIKPLEVKNPLKQLAWKKKSFKVIPHDWWKKSHLKWPPIGGKKKWLEIFPIGDQKKSFELIPIGVKWPTINKEKKVIRVTPLNMKKIHLSDFISRGCEKTFHLKELDMKSSFLHELTPLVGEK
jgi:hypothetical protein